MTIETLPFFALTLNSQMSLPYNPTEELNKVSIKVFPYPATTFLHDVTLCPNEKTWATGSLKKHIVHLNDVKYSVRKRGEPTKTTC